jgi:hypothetical protein
MTVNDLDIPTAQRERKAYFTLAAQFALIGMELVKGDPEVRGQAQYYVVCEFTMKPLADLEAARHFLDRAHQGQHHAGALQDFG